METKVSRKRIIVATLFGLAVGVLCASGAFAAHFLQFTTVNVVWVLLNRGVMGFAIGVSGLRLRWAWNGVVVGLIVGSVFSYFLFMQLGPVLPPFGNAVMNGLFGLIIEFFTTVVFRAPSPYAHRRSEAPATA
ncbi:MAG TPA: hypothetical protein VMG34_13155 [Bacteroidota bacterium]|nr:hypothetical protein [Bacteroidota bacterium]